MAGTTFRTAQVAAAQESGAGALVVHCSDPRYQPHFQDFVRRGLGIDHYALLAVPGGAHFLTLTEYLPKFSWAGWHWLKFFEQVAHPNRIVLIAHDDCRWYHDARFAPLYPGRMADHQRDDLHKVRTALLERFPHVTVDAWFGRLVGDCAEFEEVR